MRVKCEGEMASGEAVPLKNEVAAETLEAKKSIRNGMTSMSSFYAF